MSDYLRLVYRAWRYRLRDDIGEIRELRRILRKGDVAADVGCHKGAYLYWMRQQVGCRGRVIAFEPQPSLAARLTAVARQAGWRNVIVHNIALSSSERTAELFVPAGQGGTPGATLESHDPGRREKMQTVPVKTMRLDSLFPARRAEPPLRLIKCDVEGHELEVFRGAEQLLRREAPALLFECEKRHHQGRDMREVFHFLAALKYEGFFFSKGGSLRPLAEFDPEVHQKPDAVPYCNNFLFQRRV